MAQASEQASRNRSTSAGTSELPQHENKRPRLDINVVTDMHGRDDVQGSEIPPLKDRPALPQSTIVPAERPTTPNASPPAETEVNVVSPTSRVTINTRPLSAQSANNEQLLSNGNDEGNPTDPLSNGTTSNADSPIIVTVSDGETSNNIPGDLNEPISISSSPSEVVIEIGPPEDVEESVGDTSWSRLLHAGANITAPSIWQTFPFQNDGTKAGVLRATQGVAEMLERSQESQFAETLKTTTSWMEEIQSSLAQYDLQTLQNNLELISRLPLFINSLLKRRVALPVSTTEADILAFVGAFASTTMYMLNFDIVRLKSTSGALDPATQRPAISPDFLRLLNGVLWPESTWSLHKLLEKNLQLSVNDFCSHAASLLFRNDSEKPFQSFATLFDEMVQKVPVNSNYRAVLLQIVAFYRLFLAANCKYSVPCEARTLEALRATTSNFVSSADGALRQAIKKQHSWLSIENSAGCLENFVRLIGAALNLAKFVLTTANLDPGKTDVALRHTFVQELYKFSLLKQFVMYGRMELRVSGIEAMSSGLVETWSRISKSSDQRRGADVLNLTIDFIRNNELMEFIFGVDCPSQVVQRSFNVIGFLCVSERWDQSDSDKAWRAVLESQDHRSAAAIVENLTTNLQHLNLESLMYMYEKIHDVPFEKFDQRLLTFTMQLLDSTIQRIDRFSGIEQGINAKMVKLCLHLLREAFTPARCSTDVTELIKENIYRWLIRDRANVTAHRVTNLARPERDELVTTLQRDILLHTEYATGSIFLMTALLHSADDFETANVVSATNYVELLLEDLIFLSNTNTLDVVASERSMKILYNARLSGLAQLIMAVPRLIDRTLCETLWVNVLTTSSSALRSEAWTTFANILNEMQVSNEFLDLVACDFLPTLPPAFFDEAVLAFCRALTDFHVRYKVNSMQDTDECLQIPAMERVWSIMLEASNFHVAEMASDYIVHTYLNNDDLVSKRHLGEQQMYAVLVDRCISTVIESANSLKDNGPDASTNTVNSQHEARLHRSLSLLRKLLNGLKSKPRFKPSASEKFGPALATFEPKGQPVECQLRWISDSEMREGNLTWTVGEESTGQELWRFLVELTGWSQINIVKSGVRLQLQDDTKTVKQLNLIPGSLQISKPIGATDIGPGRAVRASSPVDSAIMHHFRDLYALLEFREPVAKAIYDFLVVFSSQATVIAEVKSMTLSAEELLPVRKPFKLLYYANALRSSIEEESLSNIPNCNFIQYAVTTVISTLNHLSMVDDHSLRLTIVKDLIETLQLALRAKVPDNVSSTYFDKPESFVRHLMYFWGDFQGKQIGGDVSSEGMDRDFLDVMIEASLHNDRLWEHLNRQASFQELLASAVLLNPNIDSRKTAAIIILNVAGVVSGKTTAKIEESRSPRARFDAEKIKICLQHLWKYLFPLVARACDMPSLSQQALEIAVAVFETVSRTLSEESLKGVFAESWTLLLTQHDPGNNIYCANEAVPLNLAKILAHCVRCLANLGITVPESSSLIRKVYQQYLFPPLSDSSSACLEEQSTPLIDFEARSALYGLVLRLCQSSDDLAVLAAEMSESAVDEDAFSQMWANDRKAIRSEQGYAGQRNLSNTCYLNSLFSQLFMNVRFRDFIIGFDIVDSMKQQLFCELSNLFANMQSSCEKYVNPQEVIESVTQYNGEQIDVTVQMDVDEFYNLLFDRLEAQLVDADARKKFKSFYGGQLVQQIKSMECEHISERIEPFSAVQIEIKGKNGLEQGLAAYVEGEVLQGENKYSCTSCGRHVDAVKRACLKEIPDNLIFNLKRFDYDIMTGMRCKVNDEFQFPETIDMMPYTVEALSSENTQLPTDIFELVGVIVHSGTAETGHYYSFIRQRPSRKDRRRSWLQFNDIDVTQFDPEHMRDQAFGGTDASYGNFLKFYNGYMLFYQRKSSIVTYEHDYPVLSAQNTTSVPLPKGLESRIAQENEICLRRYVAQDPSHAKFIRHIAERIHHGESGSTPHVLESQLLGITLDYVNAVSSRLKDAAEFEETMRLLGELAKACPRCALAIMEWFYTKRTVVGTIMQAFYTLSRRMFSSLLYTCYSVLTPLRSSNAIVEGDSVDQQRVVNALDGSLKLVSKEWSQLQRFPRSWDQVFGLLNAVAKSGDTDVQVLLDHEFLAKAAEIIWMHMDYNRKPTPLELRKKYTAYIAAREKNKAFNHGIVMQIFSELLPFVNLQPEFHRERSGIDASNDEQYLLGLKEDGSFDWLRRLVAGGSNPDAADEVVKELCTYPSLLERTTNALFEGLERSRQYNTACRFLRPCFMLIKCCTTRKPVLGTIKKCLAAVADSDGHYSSDYYDFVEALAQLEGVQVFNQGEIRILILQQLSDWAPALLMAPNEIQRNVRNDAMHLIQRMLFGPIDEDDIDRLRQDKPTMRQIHNLTRGCISYVVKHFLDIPASAHEQRFTLTSGQSAQIVDVLRECQKYLQAAEENAGTENLIGDVENVIQELEQLEAVVENEYMYGNDEASSEPTSDIESFESP
ncbi:hypothetical protein LTR51_000643 [Lithohypha guttulata]|nr:hypothetical protein LTR51_000643 [Lithohypha guttulata]